MKILFTSHKFYPDIGGIEVNSEILARYFVKNGHEVCLVTQTKERGSQNFPFSVFRRPSFFQLIKLYYWSEIVYQNNIEIRTLWPKILVNKPVVISVRTWIRGHMGRVSLIHIFKKWILSRANKVIAISEAIRRDSSEVATVIGNPYRNKMFRNIPGIHRKKSVVFLGRLVPDKGVDILIDAFSKIQSKCDSLTIIGEGSQKSELINMAQKLGLKVHFTGQLEGEELVRELNRHMILAVPSLWEEPFGNVALEGMACGCVVVGSNAGGLPDAIGPGGILFERGDTFHLADQLGLLLDCPQLVEELRKKAINHLISHKADEVGSRYLSILMSCLMDRPKSSM
jgi:glycosyltransferase involved in cell wall biosynthesis